MPVVIVVVVGVALLVWLFVSTRPRPAKVQVPKISPVAVQSIVAKGLKVSLDTGYHQDAEDLAFEKLFDQNFGHMADKHFYARVAGVSKSNPDGTSRQELLRKLQLADQLKLVRDPNNVADSNAVQVFTHGDQLLGFLKRENAADIAWDIDHHSRVWFAMVRKVTPPTADFPSGLVICMFRISEAYLKETAAKLRP